VRCLRRALAAALCACLLSPGLSAAAFQAESAPRLSAIPFASAAPQLGAGLLPAPDLILSMPAAILPAPSLIVPVSPIGVAAIQPVTAARPRTDPAAIRAVKSGAPDIRAALAATVAALDGPRASAERIDGLYIGSRDRSDEGSGVYAGEPRTTRNFWGPALALAAILPLSSSVHELGHFVAARASGRAAEMKVQKVLIADHDSLSFPKQLMISLAGPAFNFLFSAATTALALSVAAPAPLKAVLWTYAAVNAFFGATNLLPFKARGFVGESGVSDGAHARDEWRAWKRARADKEGLDWKALAALDRRPPAAAAGAELKGLEASDEDAGRIRGLTRETLALEPRYAAFTARDLRGETAKLKRRRAAGTSPDALLPEAFALAAEAMARTLGKRPYPEQIAAAVALHFGRAVEQKTGEGKTLSIGLAAYLGALDGPVDVYTFNPYLAARDADEIGRPLTLLGLSVGALEGRDEAYVFSGDTGRSRHASERALARVSRAELYRRADVVYGHTNGFIFDHLFDQDAASRLAQTRRRRPRNYAIVDEVDAAMMEEADSDFRIVSRRPEPEMDYAFVYALTGNWKLGEDYTLDEKRAEATLLSKAERFLDALRASDPRFARWTNLPLYARNALKARHLLKLDRDYAVVMKRAVILDPHTGRLMHGRSWEDGLHRFVEVKEGLSPEDDYRLSSHISLDAYFRLYAKRSGISGTLDGTKPEFDAAYGLPTVVIPPHRPSRREDRPPKLYRAEKAKLEAVVAEALAARRAGRAVLLGAKDMAESALIARMLADAKEPFQLLNGMQADEKSVIAEAGQAGSLTVATQLAGRGTDIKLSPKALESGGLLVLLTSMSESRRVDLQYRGRAGRQGEPGETRLFVSLEDDLIRLRATEGERAEIEAALSADGMEASAEAAAALGSLQDRAESQAGVERDVRRLRDRRLAPVRERYFRRRALLRRLPGAGRLLASLHEGWGEFMEEHEEAWRANPQGPSADETARAYDRLVLTPSWKALAPWRWIPAVAAAPFRIAARYFAGTFYARAGGLAARRVVTPLWVNVRVSAARLAALVHLRAVAVRLLRGALADSPQDWKARHRLAALLFERKDYGGAADEFAALLQSLWKPSPSFSDEERRVIAQAIDNLAISLEARARAESAASRRVARAQTLRLAYELSPTTERKAASDKAAQGLSEAESSASRLTPPFMRLVYLDKARTAVDQGSAKNAEHYFTRVIEMAPNLATAFIGRGYARKQLKDEEGASRDLLESLRLRILDSRQFGNMRLAYSLSEGSSLDAARVDAAFAGFRAADGAALPPKAGASARESALGSARAAQALLESSPSRALAYAETAVRQDPRLSAAYDVRGSARFKLGRYRLAYEDYADSLLWELLDDDGAMGRLIAGHKTIVQWKPDPGSITAFIRKLKSL
jgi:preprotein translocase subunit SecA